MLQADGRIVLGGQIEDGDDEFERGDLTLTQGDLALARYEGDTTVADTTPPETTIDSGPSGTTNDSDPSFAFSSDEPGSTFECRLDGPSPATEAFAACTSPKAYSGLADGAYTLRVRATDGAGNTDPTPATRGFTVDTAPPSPPPPSPPPPGPAPVAPPAPLPGPVAPSPPAADGKARPILARPGANARQVGQRIVVKVTGRLVRTQGRPCSGPVAVGVRTGGRGARHAFRIQRSGKGPCTYRTVFRFRVGKLRRAVRPRGRRLLLRVNSSYKGSDVLEADKAPSVLKRAIR